MFKFKFYYKLNYIHNNVEYNEQWHSQTQYMWVGHNLSLLTALIEYLTVLLEYIDKIINISSGTEENWLGLRTHPGWISKFLLSRDYTDFALLC